MNPGRRSPMDVYADPDYAHEPSGHVGCYPAAAYAVVRHIASGTYWRALYNIRKDDSDFEDPVNWTQVRPFTRTILDYEVVK